MSDLIERLRDGLTPYALNNKPADAHEAKDQRIAELEGDLEVMRLQRDAKLVSETPQNNALKTRIEQLEAALQWEAAVAGDECAYPTGKFCFDDKPESPDLWCTYCRIIWTLGEKE